MTSPKVKVGRMGKPVEHETVFEVVGTLPENASPVRPIHLVWVERLQPCLDYPGQWARVAHYKDTDTARAFEAARRASIMLRKGRYPKPDVPGTWQFHAHRGSIYAEYRPPEAA